MLLRCRRRIVRDGIDDSRVTGTVMVRFRCVVVVRVFHPAPVHQWPILHRSGATGTPRQGGRRHVVVGARDVGVARQQVRRRDEESAAGAATVSRLVDRSRRLRTLRTGEQSQSYNEC